MYFHIAYKDCVMACYLKFDLQFTKNEQIVPKLQWLRYNYAPREIPYFEICALDQ